MKWMKIFKGHYRNEMGFELIYDHEVEGFCKWVVYHEDGDVLNTYFEKHDGLWGTLSEGKERLSSYCLTK
jgi:hypothetical protein